MVVQPPVDVVLALRRRVEEEAYAIDESIHSSDVDDALSLSRDELGREWIHIHIADPSRWIVKVCHVKQVSFAL